MTTTPDITEWLPSSDAEAADVYIGKIPIRNIWLLLLYASELYQYLPRHRRVALEEAPDNIPDLVAEILTYAVERRLRRNLSFGYQRVNADLTRVRGSINFLRTECHQLLQRGKVASTYEELTVDTLRNRFVKAALLELSRAVNHRDNQKLVRKCRVASGRMARAGISDSPASMYRRRRQEFSTSRINTEDREMLAAARLAFDLSLPTEDAGASRLAMPSYERESWALFEGAVRGFYAKNLGDKGWEVSRGSRTHWPVEPEQRTPRLILPSMQTDIVLKRPNPQHRIIVDTKFKSVMVRGRDGRETLRSGDIYQLYAYLRSQEKPCDQLSINSTGILLYPAIHAHVDDAAIIQGHEVRFATVDLTADSQSIRRRLLDVAMQSPLQTLASKRAGSVPSIGVKARHPF